MQYSRQILNIACLLQMGAAVFPHCPGNGDAHTPQMSHKIRDMTGKVLAKVHKSLNSSSVSLANNSFVNFKLNYLKYFFGSSCCFSLSFQNFQQIHHIKQFCA